MATMNFNGTVAAQAIDVPADPVRYFPDANLAAAVRTACGLPPGADIHQSDLDLVTIFEAYTLGIVDLTGMEYWTTLTFLDLHDNGISTILSLASLTNLTELYLNSNSIIDISTLASLINLTFLELNTNWIADISSLVGILGTGDNLGITNNPLNVHAYSTDIPALEVAGIIVDYDPEPIPTVTDIDPDSGTTAGGTAVTITGTNFLDGATATIDGEPCTDVVFVDSTSLTAVTPAGTAGAKDVVVTNDVETGTLVEGYEYT